MRPPLTPILFALAFVASTHAADKRPAPADFTDAERAALQKAEKATNGTCLATPWAPEQGRGFVLTRWNGYVALQPDGPREVGHTFGLFSERTSPSYPERIADLNFTQDADKTKLSFEFPTPPTLKTPFGVSFRGHDLIADNERKTAGVAPGTTWIHKVGSRHQRDQYLAKLAGQKALAFLDLRETNASDAGMKSVRRMEGLHTLRVSQLVTDAGLKELAGHEKLEVLDLSDTRVTAAGLRYLQKLPALRGLVLANTMIDDAAMKEVAKLKGLTFLDLSDTLVTDKGVAELKGLTSLLALNLSSFSSLKTDKSLASRIVFKSDGRITDKSLAAIAGQTSLEYLNLRGTGITAVGGKALTGFPKLMFVDLSGTNLTQFAFLSELKELEVVFGAEDGDAVVEALKDTPKVRMLFLRNLTSGAVPGLKRLTKLERVYVVTGQLTQKDADDLRAGLPDCEWSGLPKAK